MVALRPKALFTTNIDATLAAGPAMSRTRAQPGDMPLSMSAAAMGMDPVAQTYMGTATSTMMNMFSKGQRA